MSERLAIIYKITNIKNNYIYVGSTTKTLEERFCAHLHKSKTDFDKYLLYSDLLEQDEKDFIMVALDTSLIKHRFIIEAYWTKKLLEEGNAMYNMKQGNTHTQNTKQRLSESRQASGFDYSSNEFKDKMRLATSGINNGMYDKKDENAVNGRIVVALDDNGNVFKTFNSVKMATQFLNTKGHTALGKACRNNEKYKGYYWKKEWVNR